MARKSNNRRGPRATNAQRQHAASLGKRRETTYAFPDHTVVTLQSVAAPMIYDLQSDAGKPVPDKMKEIKMAGGMVTKMPDTDDEDYKEAIKEWEIKKAVRYARTMILEAVKEWPPDEDIQYWVSVGFNDPVDIKYYWIARKLINQELEHDFYQTIMGLSVPTDEGLDDAEATFPGDGQPGGETVDSTDGVEAAAEEEGTAG